MSAAGIEKIVQRLEARIAEGQYYEAQQQARVVASRHIKGKKWDAAIDLLYGVAQALLKAKQGGSGGDLSIMMVDVFTQGQLAPDVARKAKVLACLRLFDEEEPSRKKFIAEMISWSSKLGEFPAGDPELHHVVGTILAGEKDVYEAEKHLTLGTKDSPAILTALEYSWYQENGSPHSAAIFCSRAVFPYLMVGNVRGALDSYRLFTEKLIGDNAGLAVETVTVGPYSVPVISSLPLLNFTGLLLAAVQTGHAPYYKSLLDKFQGFIADVKPVWGESLDTIAEMYFKIQRPRQSNPLMDMMGSFLGGGQQAAPKSNRVPITKRVDAPPTEGLD